MQFEKHGISCLQTVKREVQTQEQTQEFRVHDGMPDIGSVIGAWGQVILRSKEWQGDGMVISGGTMVWVLYHPEDGGQPQCVESWLPFQMRWSFPQTQHDGKIMTQCCLHSVDARSTSARKMMLRTNVAVLGWAVETQEYPCYRPVDVPEDVQMQTCNYPVQLPVEAGEKAFVLEESLTLPPSAPAVERVISVHLEPQITEEKLLNDKVVFRGNTVLHMRYLAEDGGYYSWDFDLPFTQYSELEEEYDDDAQIMIWPCVTALELEKEDDGLKLKSSLVCQYRISRQQIITVVEDAYSPRRSVTLEQQELLLPGVLDSRTQSLHCQVTSPVDAMRMTAVQFATLPVQTRLAGDSMNLQLQGQFQMLYYDMNGTLRTGQQKWESAQEIPVAQECMIQATLWPKGKAQGSAMAGNVQLAADMELIWECSAASGIPMVTALELGELQPLDSRRPSLIICCPQGKSLWELAKENGSTIAAIQEANHLQSEPEEDRMILIPVL